MLLRVHVLTVPLAWVVAGCSRSGGRGTAKPAAPSARPTSTAVSASTSPSTAPAPGGRLSGKTIVVDPGHNGGNASDPTFINKPVWNGRESEACDTAGAATRASYAESTFNWNVAQLLKADQHLRRCGRRAASQRSGRCQPVDGAQGVHRVREHGQHDRRRPARVTDLAAAGRSRPGQRIDRLPRGDAQRWLTSPKKR